jgi:hypothetical protein
VTWWRSLATLLCVLTALVSPRNASASSGVQAENRVRGFDLVAVTLVGTHALRAAEKHWGNSVAYDETASGYTLAAEAVDATAAAGLRAQLAAQQTLASSGRIFGAEGLELGASRTALFDTASGSLHVGPNGAIPHFDLRERLGLPLEGGRYVGGFLQINSEGRVIFNATSGTFPWGAAGGNALDLIRGTGVTVVP